MSNYIICDVDDSIIKTDLLFEQWLILLKQKPILFITSIFWLIKGLAYFKQNLAKNTHFDASLLPYRENVIDFIKNWKIENKGNAILISASPEIWVNQISDHLKLFEL